jgi:hypothetical protein
MADEIEVILGKYSNNQDNLKPLIRELQKTFGEVPKEAVVKLREKNGSPINLILKTIDDVVVENACLKGVVDEDLGVYSGLFSGKSCFEGQDGGMVTALLVSGLKQGLFDAAVVVRGKGTDAQVTVAQTSEEVLTAKYTKYQRMATTQKMRELISKAKKKTRHVGTPSRYAQHESF